jgi:hypothetical protein
VVGFLAQQWIKNLVIVHAREGAASPAWAEALETVDQLLWSVAAKPVMEDRRKLAAAIPQLLKRLKSGVAAAGIDPAATAAFFPELMKLHTDVMRAPPPAAPRKEDKPGAGAKRPGAPAKAPPPADVHADLLDFTAPVTVNNPFGVGTVDVSSEDLDFTAAPDVPAANPPPASAAKSGPRERAARASKSVRLPSAMVTGAWVEILLDADADRREPALLHYVSPMKSHFLFVDRQGKKVYECSRSMLARRLKLGEVRVLDGEPDASLFDRIMEGLFGKLKAKAPAPETATA